jgi:hypothetical protein
MPEIEPQLLCRPSHSLVAIPTELYRLSFCAGLSQISVLTPLSRGYSSGCVIVSFYWTYPSAFENDKILLLSQWIPTGGTDRRSSRKAGTSVSYSEGPGVKSWPGAGYPVWKFSRYFLVRQGKYQHIASKWRQDWFLLQLHNSFFSVHPKVRR